MSQPSSILAKLHESEARPQASRPERPEFLSVASLLATRAASGPQGQVTVVADLDRERTAREAVLDIGWTLRSAYGSRVLVVEIDFRAPEFVNRFSLNRDRTLAAALADGSPLSVATTSLDEGFAILPAASWPGTASLPASMFGRIRDEMAPLFDVTLLAASPVGRFSDAFAAAPAASQLILVVESGLSTVPALQRASARASQAGLALLGTILSYKKRGLPSWFTARFRS